MCAMRPSPIDFHDSDFAAVILRRFEQVYFVGGFDEQLTESLADIDLCLKMRRAGYLIVYTPIAKLYRYEAEPIQTDADAERIFRQRLADVVQHDAYYNPNLSRERADFTLGK
jgi:GT2 family glycosyltransferase